MWNEMICELTAPSREPSDKRSALGIDDCWRGGRVEGGLPTDLWTTTLPPLLHRQSGCFARGLTLMPCDRFQELAWLIFDLLLPSFCFEVECAAGIFRRHELLQHILATSTPREDSVVLLQSQGCSSSSPFDLAKVNKWAEFKLPRENLCFILCSGMTERRCGREPCHTPVFVKAFFFTPPLASAVCRSHFYWKRNDSLS